MHDHSDFLSSTLLTLRATDADHMKLKAQCKFFAKEGWPFPSYFQGIDSFQAITMPK